MADIHKKKREWKQHTDFPLDKEVDLVATKDDMVRVQTMRYGKARNLPKNPAWRYQYFQVGFHSYKEN